MEANPEVSEVIYDSKEVAFEEFQRVFADSPVLNSRTVDDMQDSFRVRLLNPENYAGVVSEAKGSKGCRPSRTSIPSSNPCSNGWARSNGPPSP
nr:permease-like cell division protein FtsX [Tessaracoccus coleopterorum]